MSTRTVAVCDVCGAELTLKTSGPVSDSEYARELHLEGWWQREDALRDICARHPAPVRDGAA